MHSFLVWIIVGVLTSASTAQECPTTNSGTFGACVEACSSDGDCTNGQLCCSNGCGRECMDPTIDPCATVRCAAPNCSEVSASTITPEGQCCPVCACTATDGSMVAAGTSFMDDCNTCSCLENGVAICTLIACVATTGPSDTTTDATELPTSFPMVCPDPSDQIGTCDERCTSDDQCANGQLCCSNGCGHACADPVISCAAVTCLRPDCAPPSVLFTPDGTCCPICVPPDTAYTPTGGTVTPSVDPTCPVRGQIRVQCGSVCDPTCATVSNPVFCPSPCIMNGCQCPSGTVIDEMINTCVAPSVCTPTTTALTCPRVELSNGPNCVDECSSDDQCQYDKICCANGCGGRTCSDSVEMCQVVDCAWPVCEDGVQPQNSPFSCCPFCPSKGDGLTDGDDDGGSGLNSIASLMTIIICIILSIFLF